MIGKTLGHYAILELLARGGMGEVYRARDLKLGRDIAIKVLLEEFSSDPEGLIRFEQEARSASALNHPNIITIYDIGKHGSAPYIAMEFVEGKTLREILADGPLPTLKVVRLASQIAEGLAKAHSAGIIHRDLKPENLMVTKDGLVKILDFGLAKLMPERNPLASEDETAPRLSTGSGIVLGTIWYTSPEQASGRSVDYRCDHFSLGSILYEMTTGKLAFQEETAIQTLSSVIQSEPTPITKLNASVPAPLQRIIERCLAKDPEKRYHSTRALAEALQSLREYSPEGLSRYIQQTDSRKPILSIAVLPLDNLNSDPEQDYFSDGMTEALITDLAKIGSLRVISRTSAMRYKGTDKSLPQIARELNVSAVLEGSVLRAGGRVRITTQLIEAETDQHLWAESYERDMRDILSLQSEVARTVAHEIKIQLTPKEDALLTRIRQVDPEAHEAYLRGRYYWNKRSVDGLKKAIQYFHSALDSDPSYALAHAGLADTYNVLGLLMLAPPSEVMPKARAAALKALETDDTLAEAHASLGSVRLLYDWDWPEAEREVGRAMDLNPNYGAAHLYHALYLAVMGRLAEGLAEIQRTLALDPLSLPINSGVAWYHLVLRQYDESLEQCQKTIHLDSTFFPAHACLALVFARKKLYKESVAELKTCLYLRGADRVAGVIERAYEQSGFSRSFFKAAQMAAWSSYLFTISKYVPLLRQEYASRMGVAILYAESGEKDMAIRWLEKCYRERDPQLVFLKVSPFWDNLRSDPRFEALVRRIGLPE